TFTVTVTGVNDAPENTVPVAQTTDEDVAKSITGLSVSDVDAGTDNITVTLSVDNGTVTVLANVSGGVAAADITSNGSGSVTLTGTVSEINTTLASTNGVVYLGNSNFNGADTLTITTNDLGHTGTGGPL